MSYLSNLTVPSINANKVSSPPLPTLVPGCILVPLCLTIILPAVTTCPSYLLTPNLYDIESLPFLEDPTPFLDANNCKFMFNIWSHPLLI